MYAVLSLVPLPLPQEELLYRLHRVSIMYFIGALLTTESGQHPTVRLGAHQVHHAGKAVLVLHIRLLVESWSVLFGGALGTHEVGVLFEECEVLVVGVLVHDLLDHLRLQCV